jgi:hypothetical protein
LGRFQVFHRTNDLCGLHLKLQKPGYDALIEDPGNVRQASRQNAEDGQSLRLLSNWTHEIEEPYTDSGRGKG